MGIVIADGGEYAFAQTSSWTNTGALVLDPALPRKNASGDGGNYALISSVTGGINFKPFRANVDTGAPLRLREVYMGVAMRCSGGDGVEFTAGFGEGAAQRVNITPYPVAQQVRVLRGGVLLASPGAVVPPNAYGLWRLRVFVAQVGGQVELRYNNSNTPLANLVVQTGFAPNEYYDRICIRSSFNAQRFDDIVVQAPSLLLTNIVGGPPAFNATLTGGTSGATVQVSDPELGNSRIWCHTWNGTPFLNGETITDGAGFTATIVAPGANFVGGFEPNSFWTEGVPFVIAAQPTTDVAVALTPTPGVPNVNNINDIPENNTEFNSALSGLPEQDRYGGMSVPAWVQRVFAVCPDAFAGQNATTYTNMRASLVDPTGTASKDVLLAATGARNFYGFNTRADGSPWTPADIPLTDVIYRMN